MSDLCTVTQGSSRRRLGSQFVPAAKCKGVGEKTTTRGAGHDVCTHLDGQFVSWFGNNILDNTEFSYKSVCHEVIF